MWKELGNVMYRRDDDSYVVIYEGMRFRIYGNLKKALKYLLRNHMDIMQRHVVGLAANGDADAVIVRID